MAAATPGCEIVILSRVHSTGPGIRVEFGAPHVAHVPVAEVARLSSGDKRFEVWVPVIAPVAVVSRAITTAATAWTEHGRRLTLMDRVELDVRRLFLRLRVERLSKRARLFWSMVRRRRCGCFEDGNNLSQD
jgi:hypothetical protein